MKPVVLGCMAVGLVAVVGLAACGGFLYWAYRSSSEHQQQFYTAVESGDPRQLTAMMHSSLKDEIDEAVLAVWMDAVNTRLGEMTGLKSFNTSANASPQGRRVESEATVKFERGTADSKLVFLNDELVQFQVDSDKLQGWQEGLTESDAYARRGEQFLRAFLTGQNEQAFSMMHESLQNNLPLNKLKQMTETVRNDTGALENIDFQESRFSKEGVHEVPSLKLYYQVECEKADTLAEVQFQFVGLKGHLLGFNLQGGEQLQSELPIEAEADEVETP